MESITISSDVHLALVLMIGDRGQEEVSQVEEIPFFAFVMMGSTAHTHTGLKLVEDNSFVWVSSYAYMSSEASLL